jgi:4-hydroxybenzoate polyprenyltransferase
MRPLIASLRPQEWIKNVLVFAGIVFSRSFDEPGAVADVIVTFVAFCAVSSAGYLFNDLRDVEHDRRHPDKRRRPIASGALAESTAGVVAVVLAIFAVVAPLALVSAEVAAIVAVYAVATVLYSVVLKRLVIIDVMTIAGLFLLRVVAGSEAVGVGTSEFLLVCTAMLALFQLKISIVFKRN